jgi:hypothetical protein
MYSEFVPKNPIKVTIQTTNGQIRGEFHVRPQLRLKDELDEATTFVAITNADVYDAQGKQTFSCGVIILHRDQIVWMVPDDELLPSLSR